MSKYNSCRLGDIATFINGRAYSMNEMLQQGKYRIVRVGNFTGKDTWYFSDMELDDSKYCRSGDLLYKWACTFGPEIWREEKAIFHYHIWKIEVRSDYVDKHYLYYLLSAMTSQYIKASHGSTMIHITKESMENNLVTIPQSVAYQKSLISILLNIDSKIELNNRIFTKLKSLLDTTYGYWFVQFDFPNENGRPYKSSGGKMVYNDQLKKEIPEGWECKKLTDLFDFMRGTEVGADAYVDKKISDSYIRFWRVRDVGDDCETWIDCNARNLTTVKPGDVVITLDGAVGKIGIDLDGAISSGLRHVVDHTNTISNATICAILQSDYVQESLRQYVSGRGSILAHASGALQHLAIPYDKNIFNKFQNVIQPIFDLMINPKEQSKQLASLRDWLLPMLMNGQVKIKE